MSKKVRVEKHNPQCSSIVPIIMGSNKYCDCEPVVEWISDDDVRTGIAKMLGNPTRNDRQTG